MAIFAPVITESVSVSQRLQMSRLRLKPRPTVRSEQAAVAGGGDAGFYYPYGITNPKGPSPTTGSTTKGPSPTTMESRSRR